MVDSNRYAPGHPGLSPKWTSSAKSGVGTSATFESRVWFTLSYGIINEVYYPSIDQANTRDMEFLVSDGSNFFSEEKRDTVHEILPLMQGVPGYRLTNTCEEGKYRIIKTVITDPRRDVLLQGVEFEPLQGDLLNYNLYVLLAPHIANRGYGNNGWIGEYKTVPMLFAQRGDTTLALACSTPFNAMSCGYVGFSDGWQDIKAHYKMTWFYSAAPYGNIALTGGINLQECKGRFVVALAFGRDAEEAGHLARASLLQNFDGAVKDYITGWQMLQARCLDLGEIDESGFNLFRASVAVLKTHEAKRFHGGMIASLSIPWGASKGDEDLGGYHLVWSRDLVESAGGLLAAGDTESTRQTLLYLMTTQNKDGHWPQNMWIDGTPYWEGVQMDETAFPILLADVLRRMDELNDLNPWSMVRQAASFLVCNGPVTQQDRWEEEGGYSPLTIAVEVAALLAADFADLNNEPKIAEYLRQTADNWNENIERWTYVKTEDISKCCEVCAENCSIAERLGIEGIYVRITPFNVAEAASPKEGFVPIKDRTLWAFGEKTHYIVSPDALALVRFGLRAPDDPRIINTVKMIDATLRTETATGPVWHRYNQDCYGEHEDGRPFDGSGVGRGWPLLTGERAHYELARGNIKEAWRLLKVIEKQTCSGKLISEQVWDAPDIPERGLFNGHPSGSAMPLAWAHAEYIKLLRSLHDGKIFDMPPQTVQRYQIERITSPFSVWRFNNKIHIILAGKILRIEVLAPAIVHWSFDRWNTVQDTKTVDTGLGVYFVDLPTDKLVNGDKVIFTFFWFEAGKWENVDYEVEVLEEKRG